MYNQCVEIADVIRQLRKELKELADRRSDLQLELEEVGKREMETSSQLASIEATATRLDPSFKMPAVRWATDREVWVVLKNRQQATLDALREIGPAHINGITDFLRNKGRDDTYPLVSAALSALRAKGAVERGEGRGVWRLADPGTVLHGNHEGGASG
jgi:hypothetical protein